MRVILGVFTDRTNAEDAFNSLKAANFKMKNLSIIMQDSAEARNLARGTETSVGEGAIVIPGIGSVLIGGPLAAALGFTGAAATTTSGAITGALAGGLLGSLMGLGIPKEEASVYEQRVKEGAILLAVPADISREDVVVSIMEDNDATDIKSFTLPTYHSSESDFAEEISHETYTTEQYHPTYAMAGATSNVVGIKGGKIQRKRTHRKRVKT